MDMVQNWQISSVIGLKFIRMTQSGKHTLRSAGKKI